MEQGDNLVCPFERKGVCTMGRGARWKQGAKVGPGRTWRSPSEGRWGEAEVVEVSLDTGWTCQDLGMDAGLSQRPTHLHTELPDLHFQLPHLGLPLSHRGPQLGHEAAALLSLIVELLVQVVLGRSHLLLLQTQAAQNLL